MPDRISKWWLLLALIAMPALLYTSGDVLAEPRVQTVLLVLAALAFAYGLVDAWRNWRPARMVNVLGAMLGAVGAFALVPQPYNLVVMGIGLVIMAGSKIVASREQPLAR